MWEWFIGLVSQILATIQSVVGDWGLAIIILTFIIRLLLTPLSIHSTKSSARMQALQPRMMEIQERYRDDPQRLNEEMMKFQRENKFNPFGGCLPLLLQMPVFFALFSVLQYHLPADAHFYNILDSLARSVGGAVGEFGYFGAIVYVVMDLLFGLLTFLPLYINSRNSAPDQRRSSLLMGLIMSVVMIMFGWNVPVGVLLYYDTSAAWGAIQQVFITNRVMEQVKRTEEEKFANQITVDVVRKERKPRPHKKH